MPLVTCPDCERSVSDQAPHCVHCGRPFSAQSRNSSETVNDLTQSHPAEVPPALNAYFPVGLLKFVVLTICTFTLYELYWAYKNWQRVRERTGENIWPFWRAFFAPLWSFSLFRRIKEDAAGAGISAAWNPTLLAVTYLLWTAVWRLPDPWWLLCLLTFVPMIPVVDTVGELTAKSPAEERSTFGLEHCSRGAWRPVYNSRNLGHTLPCAVAYARHGIDVL
jgi:hypothetical protein